MTNRQQVFCNYIQYLKIRAENNFNFYSFMHDTVIHKIINFIYTKYFSEIFWKCVTYNITKYTISTKKNFAGVWFHCEVMVMASTLWI